MQISKDNLSLFAAKHYDNPFCLTVEEFNSDVQKFTILKRLLSAYTTNKNVNIQIIMNTTIGIYNVFDHKAATAILEFKLSEDQYALMNSVLLYLRYPLIGQGTFDNAFLLTMREIYQ